MTSFGKLAAALLLGATAVGLGGCATGVSTKVSRFHAMPAPAGQSFAVVPADRRDFGTLEFQRYAALVADAMQAQGFRPAPSPRQASMLVRVDYGLEERLERRSVGPSYGPGFYPYGGYYSPWHYPRFGRFGSPFYYGWDDPFYGYGSGYGGGWTMESVYLSHLDVDIRRRADNIQLFDGRARARSYSEDLNKVMPSLVTAMFTGFPGRSGETVRITVPPPNRR